MKDRELISRFVWLFDTSPSYETFSELGGKLPKHLYRGYLDKLGYDSPSKSSSITVVAFIDRDPIVWGSIERVSSVTGQDKMSVKRLSKLNEDGKNRLNHSGFLFKRINQKDFYKYLYREDFWELFEPLGDL